MHTPITIKSSIRDYTVNFVDDFSIPLAKELGSGSFFIIDSNVYKLYFDNNIFDKSAKNFLIIKASELNKSIDKCKEIVEILVEKKIRHNQRMVAIGGGIIQDITSFTASIYLRGIEWSFFPTTLLAQADSCIGGKTSINLGTLKNIVGNFNPPVKIYLDIDFLATLSKEDIKSGIGEILHFYYYSNSPYIKEIANTYDDLIINPKSLLKYIKESLMIKKTVIETDEFDMAERNKFNYGHTFGHAIETSSNYSIKHGQAVTVGMDIANYISNYVINFVNIEQKTFASKTKLFTEKTFDLSKNDLLISENNLTDFRKSHPLTLDTPELQLQRLRLLRDVEVNQEVFITLRNQLEIAKIEESKERLFINILDKPEPSIYSSHPKIILILLIFLFFGFFINILFYTILYNVKNK